jgi:predicted TIM-barrel fold metal-dependent hydrolase
MRILDTHLHLIDVSRFAYPWLAALPALNRTWSAEHYFAEAIPLGIEQALHMEAAVLPSQALDEVRVASGAHPQVAGVVAAADPGSASFPGDLDALMPLASVRGIRLGLNVLSDDPVLPDLFVANLRLLAPHRLPFDLCVTSRQLRAGIALADACPDVQFVLDHCGMPDIARGGLGLWRKNIKAIARHPNVAAKISGLVTLARPDWRIDDLKPYVLHVVDCFGWDRVVWGSDYPICTVHSSLAGWVRASRELVAAAGANADEEAALFHRNAERIYRF